MDNDTGIPADECREMPRWLTHTNQKTKKSRGHSVAPVDPCSFTVTDMPDYEQLRRFVAWQMRHVKRKLIFKGYGFAQLDVITAVATEFKPWQYRWDAQNNGSEQYEAQIICVGEWIAQGKYDEGLK